MERVIDLKRASALLSDDPFFCSLRTGQPGTAGQLCKLYGQRMTIEQLFRDDKSKRNGWSLRDTQITNPIGSTGCC